MRPRMRSQPSVERSQPRVWARGCSPFRGPMGSAAWNRGWNSTMHVLMLLRDMGLDPASDQARHAVGLVRDRVTWQGDPAYDGNPFFAGEVEPCINGQVGAVGAYFGQDVQSIIEQLLRATARRWLELRSRERLDPVIVQHHDLCVRGPAR